MLFREILEAFQVMLIAVWVIIIIVFRSYCTHAILYIQPPVLIASLILYAYHLLSYYHSALTCTVSICNLLLQHLKVVLYLNESSHALIWFILFWSFMNIFGVVLGDAGGVESAVCLFHGEQFTHKEKPQGGHRKAKPVHQRRVCKDI